MLSMAARLALIIWVSVAPSCSEPLMASISRMIRSTSKTPRLTSATLAAISSEISIFGDVFKRFGRPVARA